LLDKASALCDAFPSSRNADAVFTSLAKTGALRTPTTDEIVAMYATERNADRADMMFLLVLTPKHLNFGFRAF